MIIALTTAICSVTASSQPDPDSPFPVANALFLARLILTLDCKENSSFGALLNMFISFTVFRIGYEQGSSVNMMTMLETKRQ